MPAKGGVASVKPLWTAPCPPFSAAEAEGSPRPPLAAPLQVPVLLDPLSLLEGEEGGWSRRRRRRRRISQGARRRRGRSPLQVPVAPSRSIGVAITGLEKATCLLGTFRCQSGPRGRAGGRSQAKPRDLGWGEKEHWSANSRRGRGQRLTLHPTSSKAKAAPSSEPLLSPPNPRPCLAGCGSGREGGNQPGPRGGGGKKRFLHAAPGGGQCILPPSVPSFLPSFFFPHSGLAPPRPARQRKARQGGPGRRGPPPRSFPPPRRPPSPQPVHRRHRTPPAAAPSFSHPPELSPAAAAPPPAL
ncbi:hypothetical protein JRQ81_004651 [Phrynocephalus forsythii]|uniref:Uncharacterized protein n=1 Tax=Phrynocephalus forsythii TaxID=171643 RepID=A0A9Q0XHJ8_9SAUR|nr:hypothetical protein JRQ81_004651 [Phrynocephalus forsythii]